MEINKQIKAIDQPTESYLRLKQILTLIPISKSTWYRGVKSGRYPKQIKLNNGMSMWRKSEIDKVLMEIEYGKI